MGYPLVGYINSCERNEHMLDCLTCSEELEFLVSAVTPEMMQDEPYSQPRRQYR